MSPSPGLLRLLSFDAPLAIAHRGGALLNPENTLTAFDHALTLGVDALECDVRLSRDAEPVVIHDATLERTTDAHGPVAAFTAAELARVDAGYRFGADRGFPHRHRGAGVPRLAELIDRTSGVPLIVEIKGDDEQAVGRVLDVVAAQGAADRVIVAGFSQVVLAAARRRDPALVTGASRVEVQAALRRALFRLAPRRAAFRVVQAPLALGGRRVLTRGFVRVLRRAGIPVHAWIVNEEESMKTLLDWGVIGLISDRPDRAVQVVSARRTGTTDRQRAR
jgi:glycerophosphoryl diester phosphodiesterase